MANEVRVEVKGDSAHLKRELVGSEKAVKDFDASTTKTVGGLASKMKGFGIAIGGALAAGLVAGAAAGVNAANDLNESVNAVNVIFGKSSDKIHAWAVDAAESMGLSRRAVNESIIPIGAMLKNMGFETDEVADKTMMLTQRAVDLGSQLNITADEAMEKFRAGLAGESEPLKAFGVDVSVAALKTEALKLGLIASGEEMDRNVKATAAMSIIMKETKDASGDFANTLEFSLSNQLKKSKANVEELAARQGQKLLPATLDLTRAFGEMVEEGGFLDDVLGVVADSVTDVANAVATAADDFNVLWAWMKRVGEESRRLREDEQDLAKTQGDQNDLRREGVGLFEQWIESERDLQEALEATRQANITAGDASDRHFQLIRMRGIPTLKDLEQAEDDAKDATKDLTAAIQEQREESKRLTDPLFNLIAAQDDLTEATKARTAALDEHGPASAEYRQASIDEFLAQQDVNAALATFVGTSGPKTRAELVAIGQQLGWTEADVDALFGQWMGLVNAPDANLGAHVHWTSSGTAPNPNTKIQVMHQGGIVPGPRGSEQLIRAQGGEEVTPLNGGAGPGSGGSTIINYYAGTAIGNERILRELLERARRQ